MFKLGDIIVYGAQGICKIDSTQIKQIGKMTSEYFVLKPLFNENTSVFVPTDNAALTAKMLSVLTKSSADALIAKVPDINIIKFANEGEKQTLTREILASGDREKLVALIKTIYLERETRRLAGKKLNIFDEQMLRKAENLFYNEMAYVYGVSPTEVINMINF